jgi:polar amino acid transport system substrate-binding protein
MSKLGVVVVAIGTAALLCVTTACSSSGSKSPSSASGAGSLNSMLPAKIRKAGVLNFVIEQHPPYETLTGTTGTGPSNDFDAAIASLLGVKRNSIVVGGGLAPALAGLLSGRYDLFSGPVEATPDREKQYDEISYLLAQTAYIVDKSKTSTTDITALCGTTVTYVSGSVLVGYVQQLSKYCTSQGKQAIKGLGLADTNSTILAVKSGRASAAGSTLDAVNAAIKADSSLGKIIQPTSAGGVKENNCYITPKSTGLGPVLQKAMQKLMENGTYKKILAKWGLSASALPAAVLNPPLEAS